MSPLQVSDMGQEPETITAHASTFNSKLFQEQQDFSLVLGGPLFQLLRRSRLSDDALELLRRRIVVISLIAWLPLLALSLLEQQALGGRAAVPFLLDVEAHVRFLIALPLLIVAELVVHQRMRFVVRQVLERHLIPLVRHIVIVRSQTNLAMIVAFRFGNSGSGF
ncbi:MAG TPA: hypothetical protein VGK77_04410 [Candidatus Binatia bacterium]